MAGADAVVEVIRRSDQNLDATCGSPFPLSLGALPYLQRTESQLNQLSVWCARDGQQVGAKDGVLFISSLLPPQLIVQLKPFSLAS